MACDPQTLALQSVCIDHCIPDGMKMAVLIYLWCQIANGAGQGGTQQIFEGNYAGSAPPFTPPLAPAIAFDDSNGRQWSYYAGAWH